MNMATFAAVMMLAVGIPRALMRPRFEGERVLGLIYVAAAIIVLVVL